MRSTPTTFPHGTSVSLDGRRRVQRKPVKQKTVEQHRRVIGRRQADTHFEAQDVTGRPAKVKRPSRPSQVTVGQKCEPTVEPSDSGGANSRDPKTLPRRPWVRPAVSRRSNVLGPRPSRRMRAETAFESSAPSRPRTESFGDVWFADSRPIEELSTREIVRQILSSGLAFATTGLLLAVFLLIGLL